MAILGNTTLTGCNSIPDFIAAGSLMMFQQTASPTSWTKQTTHNNKALRVVSGTAGTGGSTAFTSVFTSRTPGGSVSGSNFGGGVSAHTLTTAQMPSHNHTSSYLTGGTSGSAGLRDGPGIVPNTSRITIGNRGSSSSHAHGFAQPSWFGSFSGSAMDFAVQYVDLIIARKN